MINGPVPGEDLQKAIRQSRAIKQSCNTNMIVSAFLWLSGSLLMSQISIIQEKKCRRCNIRVGASRKVVILP